MPAPVPVSVAYLGIRLHVRPRHRAGTRRSSDPSREGIPYAVGVHGLNRSDLASEGAMRHRRRKWGLERAGRVVACTRWLADQVERLARRPVDFVHLGISRELDDFATPGRVEEARARLGPGEGPEPPRGSPGGASVSASVPVSVAGHGA